MSKVFISSRVAKDADVTRAVVLNDQFLQENSQKLQVEAIARQTMANAESRALTLIHEAQAQAEAIIAAAEAEAARLIEEEGVQKRDAIVQEAYAAGHHEGLEDGLQEIANRLADKITAADTLIEKAFDAEKQITGRYQTQLTEMLHYIIGLVFRHELQTTPEHLCTLMTAATDAINASGTVRIMLNPDTLQQLKTMSPELLGALTQSKRLVFVSDETCRDLEMYLEGVDSSFNISPEKQAEIYLATALPLILPINGAVAIDDTAVAKIAEITD